MFSTSDNRPAYSRIFSDVFPGTLLAFLYFLLLLPWLAKNRLLGLDESIYADIAWSEVQGGHWWPLIFRGQPFWDKPPLYLWMQGLAVEIFGRNEFSIRILSALAGALCIHYVSRLGTVLGNSLRVGFFCALAMLLQEHFILYSRIGTLDMVLLACFLGTWWHMTKAFNPPSHEAADRELLFAGLWMAAGVSIKSWYGFSLSPALFFALLFCRPWPFTASKVFSRLFLPALLVMILWMTASALTFGSPYLHWAWEFDLKGRFGAGGWNSLNNLQYHAQFYSALAQEGLAFLWPFLPLSLFLWVREGWSQSARGWFDSTSVIGSSFFFYYLFFILFFIATLINYLLPLLPVAALSLAFLFRFEEEKRVILAATFAAFLGLVNGLTQDEYALWVLVGSFVCCFLLVLPAQWGPRRTWLVGALVLWSMGTGIKAFSYWIDPPDPNRIWVLAVLEHPAEYPGQNLYFVGEETDARVLEFYSNYHVISLAQMPTEQPEDGALLFRNQNRAVYLFPSRAKYPRGLLK